MCVSQLQYHDGYTYVTLHLVRPPITSADLLELAAARRERNGIARRPAREANVYYSRPKLPRAMDKVESKVFRALQTLLAKVERSVPRSTARITITDAFPFNALPSPFCRRRDAPLGALCCEVDVYVQGRVARCCRISTPVVAGLLTSVGSCWRCDDHVRPPLQQEVHACRVHLLLAVVSPVLCLSLPQGVSTVCYACTHVGR